MYSIDLNWFLRWAIWPMGFLFFLFSIFENQFFQNTLSLDYTASFIHKHLIDLHVLKWRMAIRLVQLRRQLTRVDLFSYISPFHYLGNFLCWTVNNAMTMLYTYMLLSCYVQNLHVFTSEILNWVWLITLIFNWSRFLLLHSNI